MSDTRTKSAAETLTQDCGIEWVREMVERRMGHL